MFPNPFKKWLLRGLQLTVAVAAVGTTALALTHPECTRHLLAAIAHGVAAGLLFAGVKILVRISRSRLACEPFSCWACYGWAVTRHELKCGLVAGLLLGLVEAMWHYLRCC